MNRNKQPMLPHLQEVIIPKENAVFWMDNRGRWCNLHGRFEHKRIIHHFNRSIRKDQNGYFVTQMRNDVLEKVYFSYDVTPLFVVRILKKNHMELVLNTGKTIPLIPSELYIESDELYQKKGDDCIKFSAHALVSLAPYLEEEKAGGLRIRIDNKSWHIPERTSQC